MDAAEAADHIRETAEEEAHERQDRFKSRAAVVIAVIAALLAMCELGAQNSKDSMIDLNIKASDAWNFYQAKNQRQTAYKLAAEDLKRQLADPAVAGAQRNAVEADVAKYEKTVARYEDEPDPKAPGDPTKGEGKKQLSERAKHYEEARDQAQERIESFDFGQMLLQLAIVLGSVSILSTSRPLLVGAMALGAGGAVLVINGAFLHLPLPLG